MNDDKLLNYAPTQQNTTCSAHLSTKNRWKKNTVYPLDFENESVRHLGTVPNPQNCKTSKNPMEIQFFTPLATNGDPLYIYYFAITWYGLIVFMIANIRLSVTYTPEINGFLT